FTRTDQLCDLHSFPTRRSSDLENAAQELQRSEFYLREGERLAHMGSWSLRPDGTFDYWSPETFVLFGFDPSEGIPTLPIWLTVLRGIQRFHAFSPSSLPCNRFNIYCSYQQFFAGYYGHFA